MKLTEFISDSPNFKEENHDEYTTITLSFKDDQNDVINIIFVKQHLDEDYVKKFHVPSHVFFAGGGVINATAETYGIAFNINNISPENDNAKAKKTNLIYYNRLITTLKNITLLFIKQYNPDAILVMNAENSRMVKSNKSIDGKRNQRDIRIAMYKRLFQNNIPSGYIFVDLGYGNVGICKPEIKKQLKHIKDNGKY
jgi:hypothetical protein